MKPEAEGNSVENAPLEQTFAPDKVDAKKKSPEDKAAIEKNMKFI